MVSITIDGVVKKFGNHVALDGIDLQINPGELFFLLGPSGCGKTTLLRAIAGFAPPDAGRILFGNEDVTRLPPHRRNAAMMFQSYALWPHMTVAKNVAFGLEERGLPANEIARRVNEALASVKMESFANRKIPELSGGQQQRIALARALVIRPRCLLLDEPLSNLDARLRLEMRSEIRRVCKDAGLTAIYVTHDQKEALSISDRMAVLAGGRIAQTGTPQEVYRRPRTRAVADFIGETNFLPCQIVGVEDGWLVTRVGDDRFHGVPGEPDWKPAQGDSAVLSIRPEAWRLLESPPPSNALAGRIGSAVYLGEIAQYEFHPPPPHADSSPMKIFELNPKFETRPKDTIFYAHAAPGDTIVLRP